MSFLEKLTGPISKEKPDNKPVPDPKKEKKKRLRGAERDRGRAWLSCFSDARRYRDQINHCRSQTGTFGYRHYQRHGYHSRPPGIRRRFEKRRLFLSGMLLGPLFAVYNFAC